MNKIKKNVPTTIGEISINEKQKFLVGEFVRITNTPENLEKCLKVVPDWKSDYASQIFEVKGIDLYNENEMLYFCYTAESQNNEKYMKFFPESVLEFVF